MQTMNISLPDKLKEFVDHQVGSGRYSSVSEYIRVLIREDEKREAAKRDSNPAAGVVRRECQCRNRRPVSGCRGTHGRTARRATRSRLQALR